MITIYPKDVIPEDRLRVVAEGETWWEVVDSVKDNGDKVMIFTKARMIMCDKDQMVIVDRFVEQSVGE